MHPSNGIQTGLQSTQPPWQQAQAENACEHGPHVRHVTFTDSLGRISYRKQCGRCGANLGDVKKIHITHAIERTLVPWDDQIRTAWQDKIAARAEELRPKFAVKRRENYSEYLDSPEWHAKRKLVLDRANGRCEGCGKNRATEVHHLTYVHIGREFLFELVAVCRECHDAIHATQIEPE